MSSQQHFAATIQQVDKRIAIGVPFAPNIIWGEKARHDVTGTINGIAIRGPLFTDSGHYWLALGPAWRRASGLDVGTTVTVVLRPEGLQIDELADDLQSAFAAAPAATNFFNSLPTFYRKNYLRWIDSAKRPATRSARIGELIELLVAGKRERSYNPTRRHVEGTDTRDR